MKAMILENLWDLHDNATPLRLDDIPIPVPSADEILIKVSACGVCHTELDEIEGRTPPPELPIIPGHQITGKIAAIGCNVKNFKPGDRVGVGWIFSACGSCRYCRENLENLCMDFRATGRDANGGYAEYMVVSKKFALPVPPGISDTVAAPLFCAGAIGLRSIRLSGINNGDCLGLSGFGASAHLVLQLCQFLYPDSPVFVFARNTQERNFSLALGASWAGDFTELPPEKPAAIIDTTPVWMPVLESLNKLDRGGRLVINAIRKEDIDIHLLAEIKYSECLWMEKEVKSVANVTRQDISDVLSLALKIPLVPQIQEYSLEEANDALTDLKKGRIKGAKVLTVR